MSEKPKVSNAFLYSIMTAMLVTGTMNTIVGKYLDLQLAPMDKVMVDGVERCYLFTHPYI
jgi:hypothetical protein